MLDMLGMGMSASRLMLALMGSYLVKVVAPLVAFAPQHLG
jgi:hypothetical protein